VIFIIISKDGGDVGRVKATLNLPEHSSWTGCQAVLPVLLAFTFPRNLQLLSLLAKINV
jgi:hypothetical protein